PLSGPESASIAVDVRATDPDAGNALILHTTSLPANSVFVDNGDGTGKLTYSPDYTVVSTPGGSLAVNFGLSADDGHGGVTPLSFNITVNDVDRPPVITHQQDVIVGTTQSLTFTTTATDADSGDTLTYTYTVSPASLPVSQGTGGNSNKLTVSPL